MSQANAMSETVFCKAVEVKWIIPEIIRLFDVCILSLLQFYSFYVYILRHSNVCSESCLYDILKS